MGVPEADDHWRSLSGGAERDPAHDDQLGHGTVHTLRLEQGTCHRSSGARLMHRTPYTGVMRSQLSLLCKRPVETLWRCPADGCIPRYHGRADELTEEDPHPGEQSDPSSLLFPVPCRPA